jgi:hypothetical protein
MLEDEDGTPLIIAQDAFDGVTPKTVPVRGPDCELLGDATVQAINVQDSAVTATVDLPAAAAALIAHEVTSLVRADEARSFVAVLPRQTEDERPPLIAVPEVPSRLQVTPMVAFLLHCSHCGTTAEGEFGEQWYPADVLNNPSSYAISEESGFEFDVDGRGAVCRKCFGERLCEECTDKIHAWTPYKVDRSDGTRAHVDCAAGKPEWAAAEIVVPAAGGVRGVS